MDAVRFLKEKKRMCDSFDDYCTGCGIQEKNLKMYCSTYIKKISRTGSCHRGGVVGGTSAGNKIISVSEILPKCAAGHVWHTARLCQGFGNRGI